MKKRIVITPGDPSGIGPEVVWKGIKKNQAAWKNFEILSIGARAPFERLGAKIIHADPNTLQYPKEKGPFVWLLEAPISAPSHLLLEGFQVGWSIEMATTLVQSESFQALVTGPIHKMRLNQGGFHFSGHTDFLAHLCDQTKVTMMLANQYLRVALVTTHIALSQVSKNLKKEEIVETINQTAEYLLLNFKIKKPKIAVCALNPHAGENGLFGTEDEKIVTPAILSAQKKWGNKIELFGPLPSDTLFAQNQMRLKKERFDAVVALYHDQGLIPVKLLDFPNTVNITLGLPIIRTSVDHGTAFDIAWKNQADPSSLISAVNLAAQLIHQ